MNEKCFDEVSKLTVITVKNLIKIADRNDIDRDNVIEYFSTLFSNMTEMSTFKHFGSDGDIEL